MENTNNSSLYTGDPVQNETENNAEGFLYSNEQPEAEKPVQQPVSLDKNTEELPQNQEINMNPNPNMNGGFNSNMNPNINGGFNANVNSNMNANVNGGYNANFNPQMNSNISSNMNPNMNANVNGGYNANFNPQMNSNMNGGYNPNMNSNMNQNMYQGMPNYTQPKKEVPDYTSKFDEKDRTENKIYAMLPYLLGVFGIIIALLAAKTSEYVKFHVRQSIKLTVCSALLGILTIPFAVLSLIPLIGVLFRIIVVLIGIVQVVILILDIVAFAQVCNGKAKEPAIIGGFNMFS